MIFVFIAMLFAFLFYPQEQGRVFYEASIGAVFILSIISSEIAKKVNRLAGTTFFIFGCSAIYSGTMMTRYSFKGPVNEIATSAYGSYSSYAIMLAMALMLFILKKSDFKNIISALLLAAILDSAAIIFKVIVFGFNFRYALLSNPSMDAAFICCFLPLVIWYKDFFTAIFMIVAVLLTKSSTGVAGVLSAIILEVFINRRNKWWIIPFSLPVVLAASYFLKGDFQTGLFQDSGRFFIWRGFFEMVVSNCKWFGFGTGTFETVGSAVQMANIPLRSINTVTDIFGWMHNDWLQILFENGLAGLTSFILFYLSILKKSFKKKDYLFPTLILLGVVGCTQMPLHLFVFQILGVVLIGLA